MSVVKRLISGSLATWVQFVIALLTQIALVPVYLSYWSPSVYGVWLAIITLVEVLQVPSRGHLQYLGSAFLINGSENTDGLAKILSSSLPFALGIFLIQVGVAWVLVHMGWLGALFGSRATLPNDTISSAGIVLQLEVILYGFFGGVGGLVIRVLAPLGFFARTAWWGVLASIVAALAPVAFVINGGGIYEAGLALVATLLIYNLIAFFDVLRLLARGGVKLQYPDFDLGLRNFWGSLALVITGLLENVRATGLRLFLVPLVGVSHLAAFATIRTGANVTRQALGTITGPLMPELMRVLKQRSQAKTEAAISIVWLVLVVILAPVVIVLQFFVEPLFMIWTRGQIDFDPILFGVLSLGVLVFALAQPAMAIVTGNNILRPQLVIATISAVLVVVGVVTLVPIFGILGAGCALLVAELFAAVKFYAAARVWLTENELSWPRGLAALAARSVWISVAGIVGVTYSGSFAWLALTCSLILLCLNMGSYWNSMPSIAREYASSILVSFVKHKKVV